MSVSREVRRLLLIALLVVAGCDPVVERLPMLPAFSQQNEASVSRFHDADKLARSPVDAEAIGRLGMLYHAYRFHKEGRQCYSLARGLAPAEYRWVYYGAMLEKDAFSFEAAESLFQQALEFRPNDAEPWAELGELYLLWARRKDAGVHLDRALQLHSLQPVAALGKARLRMLDQNWPEVISLMTPLIERHPRLSKAHRYLAAAYGALGEFQREAFHLEQGEYGSAVTSELLDRLNELAVPAILHGDPGPGRELLREKCARCHNSERIYDHDRDRKWWARTVRRMQREAGWQWLTDDQAASVVAYLADRRSSELSEPGLAESEVR